MSKKYESFGDQIDWSDQIYEKIVRNLLDKDYPQQVEYLKGEILKLLKENPKTFQLKLVSNFPEVAFWKTQNSEKLIEELKKMDKPADIWYKIQEYIKQDLVYLITEKWQIKYLSRITGKDIKAFEYYLYKKS